MFSAAPCPSSPPQGFSSVAHSNPSIWYPGEGSRPGYLRVSERSTGLATPGIGFSDSLCIPAPLRSSSPACLSWESCSFWYLRCQDRDPPAPPLEASVYPQSFVNPSTPPFCSHLPSITPMPWPLLRWRVLLNRHPPREPQDPRGRTSQQPPGAQAEGLGGFSVLLVTARKCFVKRKCQSRHGNK